MKIAHLTIGDRGYYLPPDDVSRVMGDAVEARASGEWFTFDDAGGNHLHLLIPMQAVLSLHEYEIEDPRPETDPNDWVSFDFDT